MDTLLENIDNQPLGFFLTRTGKSYLSELNQQLSNLDIERNYYSLIIIERGQGQLTQNELAAALGTDKVSVVRIVDYLVSKGYIRRLRSKEDKRKFCLVGTPKALLALPHIRKAIAGANEKALSSLSVDEKKEFIRMLGIIKSNLNSSKTF